MAQLDTPETTDLWAEAIRELDESDRALIWGHAANKLNVLDDVLESAREKERLSKQKRWVYRKRDGTKGELHDLFNRVVDKVAHFKKLGDSIAALDPTHLAIPWAAVGLGLQIAVNYFEHDSLAQEGLQVLVVLVPRYTVFENLYLGDDSQINKTLKAELVRMYSRALVFIAKLKTYYEKGIGKRVLKSVWTPVHLKQLIDEVRSQQTVVDDLGRLVDAERQRDAASRTQSQLKDANSRQVTLRKALEDFQDPIQEIHDGMVDLVRNLKVQEEAQILNWLSRVSYDKYHQSLRVNRMKGTGLWVFDQPQYKHWRTSAESSVLWLHGQPGTGKSTLMSLILDSVRANQAALQASRLAYIYCSRNAAARDDEPESLTRNIIKQLSRPGPGKPLRGAVVQKYQDMQEQRYGMEVLAFPDTRNLLMQMVEEGTTMIFVDAVDECTPAQQKELFQIVRCLLEPHDRRAVKILISSRPSLEISTQIRALDNSYTIDAGQNRGDIESFARLKANECAEDMKLRMIPVSSDFEARLARALIDGAQGMFLWIKLQADLLSDPTQTTFEEDALRRVREAPEELSGVYSSIYSRIQQGGRKMRETAVTMIHWLLCTAAPLGRGELRVALSRHIGSDISEEIIIQSCINLVMVDNDLNTFRFIHTSVKDFFEGKAEFSINSRNATAADVCLRELTQAVTIPPSLSLKRESLYCYSILYWVSHVEKAGPDRPSITIEDAIRDLCLADGGMQPWFTHWLEKLQLVCEILDWNDPFKDKVLQALSSPETSFFAGCAFGIVEVVARYRQIEPALFRAENAMGATGLHLACQYGHLAVAKELLNGRAEVDAKDKYEESALIRASCAGHDDIVEFLLSQGANAKIQGRRFGTALQAAALHGHLGIVRRLIRRGVDIEAEGGQFGTALQAASVRGHLQVVKELLASGADINAPGGAYETIYETAPTAAIAEGVRTTVKYILDTQQEANYRRFRSRETRDEDTVQLSLDRTLDMNLKKSGFGPAIHSASRAGHKEVVDELISSRLLDVNSEGGRYGSCLQAAAVSGSVSIAATLLKAGADVNSQNGTYGTPLAAACRRSHYSLAEFLVGNGAGVNIEAGAYGTPLQAAARSGNCDIVRLLLDNGANPNLVAGMYATPLQAAARDGFLEIIKLCLDRGADTNIEGGSFGTALQAASGAGHLDAVKPLLENGAQVGNALQVACLGGHRDVVECLLTHGANIESDARGFRTPIEAAAAGNHLDLLSFLVQKSEGLEYPRQALNAALERAAESGDEPLTRTLLERGADPQNGMEYGMSHLCNMLSETKGRANSRALYQCPLERAARNGHESVFQLLLSRVNRSNSCPEIPSALESAAEYGHINIVQILLHDEIGPEDQSDALSAATRGGHDNIVRLLVGSGARATPDTVIAACRQGNPEILNFLLTEAESYLSAETTGPALLHAALQGNCDMVEILIQYGTDVNALTNYSDFEPYIYHGSLKSPSRSPGVDAAASDHDSPSLREEREDISQGESDSESADNFSTDHLSDSSSEISNTEGLEHQGASNEDINDDFANQETNTESESVDDGDAEDSDASASSFDSVGYFVPTEKSQYRKPGSRLGITALHGAIFAGHEPVARILLEHNASFTVKGLRVPFVLQMAALFGRVSIVKTLVDMRAGVNEVSGRYGTALQAAAFGGSKEVVRILLESNADVNQESGRFGTALQAAASQRHEAVVQHLLDAGADVQREGGTPKTNLSERERRLGLASIHTLFERQPLRWQNGLFGTSLQAAANAGSVEIVRLLLDRGADIGVTDVYGQTPLHHAACQGHEAVVALLLQRGANPNSEDRQGRSSIIMAASNGWKSVLARLGGAGASPISTNKACSPALHHAASNGHVTVLEQLLAQGYDIDLKNRRGETPLMMAAEKGRTSAVRFLLDKGSDFKRRDDNGDTAIERAVLEARSAVVRLFLARGLDPNERDDDGPCLLHIATSNIYDDRRFFRPGSAELQVLYALANHPGIQLELRDGEGATALHRAAGMWNPWMLAILVDSGADIEARDAEGLTPLHYCACSPRQTPPTPIAALQYLVSKGADINARSNNGENVRMRARRCLGDSRLDEKTDQYLAGLGLQRPSDEADSSEDERSSSSAASVSGTPRRFSDSAIISRGAAALQRAAMMNIKTLLNS
ncbi:uncharacterized protein APUU_21899S [Aspergillus puulaauensis]|uniref:NACHT domain-containing protein n=1 Tax=Aspergillus puulaauensis TaxID=1220207 RepID=A0A7R7XHK2_9EURO|nr:uncharacterized protein APUU_21899S [Aspergillus puulaauensis]BCS21467.1 hypothetical protein APUU_21899S [Aspergillus puulaauensis]